MGGYFCGRAMVVGRRLQLSENIEKTISDCVGIRGNNKAEIQKKLLGEQEVTYATALRIAQG